MADRFISEKTETGEIIIFDTVTQDTHVLNSTAALVYEQHQEHHTIMEIVNMIIEKFPDSPAMEEIHADVEGILEDLRNQKLVY